MKIATVIGARPQFIKAALISHKINTQSTISQVMIHTGQHYEPNMSDIFFNEMQIPYPDYNLNINKMNHFKMVKKMVKKIDQILKNEKINAVIVFGDTNSTLAASLSASKNKIPIFHIEAGLRSFNRNMLEENNRIITDHLSSLLFCPTETAVKNLSNENIYDGVVNSGDIMYDLYLKSGASVKSSPIVSKNYILLTLHRRENINSKDKLVTIFKMLNLINKEQKIVMPLHPHTKKKIKDYNILSDICFLEPLSYEKMMQLLNNCKIIITDSGGLQKESFFAKKKCITIRDQTEWVELLKEDSHQLCKPEDLYDVYKKILNIKSKFSSKIFGNGDACDLIPKSIFNYIS